MLTTSAIALALAISFDSLLAGVSYGASGIRVPLRSLLIPGLITGVVFFSAMNTGNVLAQLAGKSFATWLGGALLVLLGAQALSNGSKKHNGQHEQVPLVTLSFMGIILHVVRDLRAADMDRSNEIDSREAVVLGVALALDAFGVGISAALAGFPLWHMTALASFITPASIAVGVTIGRLANLQTSITIRKLPAWALITIGLLRLLN